MSAHPETAPYLEAFRAPRGEPRWLAERRRAALARFAELGFPTRREEAWRFTDLRPLQREPFLPQAGGGAAADVARWRHDGPSHRLVLVDGKFAPSLSDIGAVPEGAFLGAVSQALALAPALVEAAFADAIDGAAAAQPFASLNAAFLSDGFLLSLPPGAALDRPVEVIHLGAGAGSFHLRNAVLLGAGSAATLIETHAGDGAHWTNEVAVLRLDAGAALSHAKLQEEGTALHFGLEHVVLGAKSRYGGFFFTAGARLARQDVFVRFAGEGAELELDGATLLKDDQEATIATFVDHAAPRCTTRELFKCVADDRAHGVFLGRIAVRPEGQRADAQQVSRNLLLSRRASVDAKPELEILADDVKCSHGATVGDLDLEQLFYLRSRGLDEETARRLLVEAFVADAVDRIAEPRLRGHVRIHLARALEDRHGRA